MDDLAEKSSALESPKKELASLRDEYSQTSTSLKGMQSLAAQGTLTFDQEIELEKLQASNDELERQIQLQETLLEIQQKAAEAA